MTSACVSIIFYGMLHPLSRECHGKYFMSSPGWRESPRFCHALTSEKGRYQQSNLSLYPGMMWPVLLGAAHIIKPNPYLDMPQQKQKHLKTPVWLIILRTVLTEIKSYPFCFWKCYMGGKNNKHSVTGSNACSCKNLSPQCKSLMT